MLTFIFALAAATAPAIPCLTGEEWPAKLSATGCYADLGRHTQAAGLIPYDLNAPLWTDGAHKRRWLGLPAGRKIHVNDEGSFDLPNGSVLMKEFAFDLTVGRPETRRLLETRLMKRHPFGWTYRTYKWNDQGTDADLLDKSTHLTVPVLDGKEKRLVSYGIPGPSECAYCHSGAAGDVLGPNSAQLDRMTEVGGKKMNQLDHFVALGLFETGSRVHLPAAAILVDPADTKAPLAARARSYLHSQCAHCHQPGGWVPPGMTLDFRYQQPLAETQTCDILTQYFLQQPRIAPGDPRASVVWRRIKASGVERMPPLGTSVIDPAANVVRDWIASLKDCSGR